jgi:hypothetical protein
MTVGQDPSKSEQSLCLGSLQGSSPDNEAAPEAIKTTICHTVTASHFAKSPPIIADDGHFWVSDD